MVGYIGERAKRKRRNIIISFVLFFIFIVGFYILPSFKVNQTVPSNSLLPSEEEISSPRINATIEELELKIFDKDQKINFRNNQIKKLKEEVKILVSENQQFSTLVSDLNDEIILNSKKNKKTSDKSIKISKIEKEYNSKILKLKNDILKLKNDIKNTEKKYNNLLKTNKKFNQEISSLKKEYKIYLSKNLKLNEIKKELENKIQFLEITIGEKNLLIKVLEDTSHHG